MAVGLAKIIKAIKAVGIVGDEELISGIVKAAYDTDNPLAFVRDFAASMGLADSTALNEDVETEGKREGETEGGGEGETQAEEKATVTCAACNDVIEISRLITIPLAAAVVSGYLSMHLDAQLKPEQAVTLKRLTYGLNQKDVRTQDGKHVHTSADAIRWLLENLVK